MKNFFLATAALSLPAASHAFLLASVKQSPVYSKKSSLFQQQYYDQNGQPYYEGGEEGGQQQNYDQGQQQYYDQQQQQQQQQYYDQGQQGNYAQDQQYQQQQQYYLDQQQQQQPADPNYNQEEPSLLITDNMSQEMARATSNIEPGGIDYLALARQRAAARVESNNNSSSDSDWVQLAEEKKRQMGGNDLDDDGWEKSLDDEGGMSDSAALGLVPLEEGEGGVMTTEGGLVVDIGDEGGDGPQLLL
ncbi:hypothetical protein ACHAXR_011424 [Thalassiosira sp. AJA248-18]